MMLEMEGDNDIMKYTSAGRGLPREEIESRLKKSIDDQRNHTPFGVWAAIDSDNNDFIGWFMLRQHRGPDYEIGYMLRKKYWGKGLATEIVKRLVEFGLDEMNLEEIQALTDFKNTPSQNVLLKAGFHLIGDTEVPGKTGPVQLKLFKIYKPK